MVHMRLHADLIILPSPIAPVPAQGPSADTANHIAHASTRLC